MGCLMALSAYLAGFFSKSIRNRGNNYFYRSAVSITHSSDEEVEAKVIGGAPYDVSLSLKGTNFVVDCTCPYMDSSDSPCKHIWATILAAEKAGHFRRLELTDDVDLVVANLLHYEEGRDGDLDEETWENPGVLPYKVAGFDSPKPSLRSEPTTLKPKPAKPPVWKSQLSSLLQAMGPSYDGSSAVCPAGRELLYVIDVPTSKIQGELILEVLYRERKMNGDWGKPKSYGISPRLVPQLPDPMDREILTLLQGARNEWDSGHSYGYGSSPCRYRLSQLLQQTILPKICERKRCFLRLAPQTLEAAPLEWDDGPAWEFGLQCDIDKSNVQQILIRGFLKRGGERQNLSEPALLLAGGLVFNLKEVAKLDDCGAFAWIALLRQIGSFMVPVVQKDEFFKELIQLPQCPRLDLPEEWRIEEIWVKPQPHLRVRMPQPKQWGPARLRASLEFNYDGAKVSYHQPGRGIFHTARRCLILRDSDAEYSALECLTQQGFRLPNSSYGGQPELELAPAKLPGAVRKLVSAGWHVEAEGKLYRQAGAFNISVTSGIDWFELNGELNFGTQTVRLPSLLAALKRGENIVRLDDGTFGLLPEEMLKKLDILASVGAARDDHVQFSRAQVGFLDALLASLPEATFDTVFARARDELQRFEGIEPVDPPDGFKGKLRHYQSEGVGWLHFLERFGFGGCLADDMGLGKTVQVLAALESRRANRRDSGEKVRPSLLVVPRSLVFNWKQEAARFTPNLRILDHTGTGRTSDGSSFDSYDVVITTYGTLRRDVLHLKDVLFDYIILDEAQAIKNASTESAKAARLLRGQHRLAVSGTPIENHLGELWSLFEFLNPGLLGTSSVFKFTDNGARNPDLETRALLSKALKPFILRRTKGQVAKDLPEKLEQTLFCELESHQRKLYDELRDYYRHSLLARVERDGIQKAKILILEALLRLRQAACHPGLVDKSRRDETSAKLEILIPQLNEVIDEGHKALVFSQFTSFLSIVRERLDGDRVPYEYLDGKTRDRAAKVERFQKDSECKLFLISLKAGGLGLNLTAAEYVYLLDPWWNPAVEAQAIDRTHRIGQPRRVFAYRLIARDTVEEKVLELQKNKRQLADAILNEDSSLIRNLRREDLELLLG